VLQTHTLLWDMSDKRSDVSAYVCGWIARAAAIRQPLVHPPGRSWNFCALHNLIHTFTDWQYIFPLALNIGGGSVLYFLLLGQADLSLAVPITNALTLIFTLLSELGMEYLIGVGYDSGNDKANGCNLSRMYGGLALVVCGVAVCVRSKEMG